MRPTRRKIEEMDTSTELSNIMQHYVNVAGLGPKINLSTDPEGAKERIAAYFKLCGKDNIKPTQAGLAMALGLSRQKFHAWRQGKIGKNEETREILNQAQSVLAALIETYMSEGAINPVAGIFLMRNNYGYKNEDISDPEEQDTPRLEGADIKALAEKYKADVPDDT